MGCCSSRESASSDNNPYVPSASRNDTSTHPDASSRHITSHSPRSSSSLPRHPPTSTVAPNKPLKPIDPTRRVQLPDPRRPPTTTSSPPHQQTLALPATPTQHFTVQWTREKLVKERADFWDTQTSGHAEIWSAYRMMVECLQRGDVGSAQGILDAAGCTCPSGELWKRVFDERGVEYKVPEWAVLEPEGIVEEKAGLGGAPARAPGEEVWKGKMRMDAGAGTGTGSGTAPSSPNSAKTDVVKIRCRMSNSGLDYVVPLPRGVQVGALVQRLQDIARLHSSHLRVSFLGHFHAEHEVVEDFWAPGKVLSVFVFEGG